MEVLGYIGAALVGISLGLLGGGGSILSVPLFVYFFALPPTQATSYSLFVVGVASAVGFVKAWKAGNTRLSSGVLFAIPSFLGVLFIRRLLMPYIPESLSLLGWNISKESLVMSSFALVMLAASLSMLRPRKSTLPVEKTAPLSFAFKAFLVGSVTGFVGAGGGFLIVPALVVLGGLTMKHAVGTSLGIIAVNSLLGFASDVAVNVAIDFSFLLLVTFIAVGGIFVGSYFGKRTSEAQLKPAFGIFVLLLGTGIFAQQLMKL
ncbi:sulfite exporter TauE/SafE family protein [Bdellovibrio sp. HCB-162]|uniref:sulfite exporter TauE/SafE family protein n=1 Tax=Bdellovibrio sp. HCB-162 TaxID=3394234 RepID=UPI0039BCA866